MLAQPPAGGSSRLMAQDFYPVIARAIAGLNENGAKARRAVYDHARTVLVRQLRKLNTGLSIGLHELEALEEAIQKVELEAATGNYCSVVELKQIERITHRTRAGVFSEFQGREAR
jgi:hypothetical protein